MPVPSAPPFSSGFTNQSLNQVLCLSSTGTSAISFNTATTRLITSRQTSPRSSLRSRRVWPFLSSNRNSRPVSGSIQQLERPLAASGTSLAAVVKSETDAPRARQMRFSSVTEPYRFARKAARRS